MGLDEAQERKERLKALRAAAELSQADGDEHDVAEPEADTAANGDTQEPQPEIRFRNAFLRDEELRKLRRDPPVLPKFDDPLEKLPSDAIATKTEDPIVSIAPKKANSDLRRDVAKKLEKLEKRTQRAIIELMREEDKRRQEVSGDGNGSGQE